MNTTNTTLIVVVIIALIVVGLIAMAWWRVQRSNRLQERFGPEYDRAVEEIGDRRHAEKELEARVAHVKALNIHALTADEALQQTLHGPTPALMQRCSDGRETSAGPLRQS